jgi:hypothetical protein
MLKLLSILVIFSISVSCTQPDIKDKDTEKATDSKQISEQKSELDKTVVAKVNDVPIYRYSLDQNLVNPLKEAIVREVLLQKAVNDGVVEKIDLSNVNSDNPKESRKMAQYLFSTDQTMRRKILENVNVNQKITDQDINNYYNKHINNYTYVRTLRFTVGSDEETANNVRKMFVGGSTVNDIRDEYGDQNLKIVVEERKMTNDPLILDNFDVIEVGAIGKPIRYTGNYDIYKITEIKKVSVDTIKASIKQNIKSNKKRDAIYNYVDNLIKTDEFNVKIIEGDQKG